MVDEVSFTVIGYTTTTSDDLYLNYYRIMMTSLRKYNNFKMVVFVLDDGIEKVKQYHFDNVEYIDFSNSRTKEYISKTNLPECGSHFAFGMDKLVNILIGPECLDYMNSHYQYDVLYRTDTDVIYTGKLLFGNFYKSGMAFGGCAEYSWRDWVKETFDYVVPIEDEVLNVGMCCFRNSLQLSFLFEDMISLFEEWDYKINTYEQDVINYQYQYSKYDLTQDGFYLGVNKKWVYECQPVCCKAFHFASKDMKPFSLNQQKWFEWCSPIYRLYQKYIDELGIDFKIPFEYKKTFLEKRFMKVGFCSIVTGRDIYCDLAIVCMQSYLATNNLEIDWIILCEDQDEIKRAYDRLDFMQSDTLHIRYELLPKVEGVDYSKYNSFGWTSDRGAEIFIRRIKYFDIVKKEYDILVTVDLDILFIADISSFIEQVYYRNDITLSGQKEPFDFTLDYALRKTCNYEKVENLFDHTAYINFGFCIMKCSRLRDDNWEYFLEISKGREEYFNTQEQAYFSAAYKPEEKIVYDDLQMLIYPRLPLAEYRHKGNCKMIHYTPSNLLTQYVDEKDLHLEKYRAVDAVAVLLFHVYHNFIDSVREYLSPEFINIVDTNAEMIKRFKKANKNKLIMLMLFYGIGI